VVALSALYVIDFKQSFLGQDLHNIFTFQQEDEGDVIGCADAFATTLVPLINTIQHEDIKNVSVKCYTLGPSGALWEQDTAGEGLLTGSEMLPVHDALNFTLKSSTRLVRPGSKRFSGIPEIEQSGGEIIQPTYIALMETLRIALHTLIVAEAGNNYLPVIVKRVRYAVPGSDPVRYAYRFPEDPEVPVVAQVFVTLLNTHVSHQISRQ
jgi:hypothetical protein